MSFSNCKRVREHFWSPNGDQAHFRVLPPSAVAWGCCQPRHGRLRYVLATLALIACALCSPAPAHAAELSARLDRDRIYLGTQTLLLVEVTNPTTNGWPTVAPVDGLDISPYGSPSIIRDLISGTTRRAYRFIINPTRSGTFEIPAVSLGQATGAPTEGPFTLRVEQAPLKFLRAQLDPPQICPGETATLRLVFQGIAPGQDLALPTIQGLTLHSAGSPRIEMTRAEGLPIATYQVQVSAAGNGTFVISEISLANAKADPVTLVVSPFVIADAQATQSSLAVGSQTLVHIFTRGLPASGQVSLVLPAGLTAQRTKQQHQGPPGITVFSFEVTAGEPGSPAISEMQLADGRKIPLPKPIVLSVHQAGQADILLFRGAARSEETIVGEPFIIDYEVFFRGELTAGAIDISPADFANRPYITVEPVQNLAYEGWSGQPFPLGFGPDGRAPALSGSGDFNGQKEQLLRFALRVTPMAAGDLDLKGLRVILRLTTREEQRSIGMFFSSSQDFARTIDVPVHRVIDPPGKTPPPGYRGLVGTGISYTATLDRTTAMAMAPLTLTLKIAGHGVTDQLKPPPLAEIRELTRDFDLSPTTAGGDVQDNTITFSQVVRPRSESVKELPALPLVYYDYVKKSYETVYSLPIPIIVTPGSIVGATAMQTKTTTQDAAEDPPAADLKATEVVALGANYPTLGKLATAAPLSPAAVITLLLAGPLALAVVWAGRTWHRRRRPQAARRHQQRELIDSLDKLTGQGEFYEHLADIVQSYLRLQFDLPPGELSADTLTHAMDRKGLDTTLRRDIRDLLASCDTGRFAVAQVSESDRNRLLEQARNLFARLEQV